MITPDRALVALATGEDVFTPAGDAVVIAAIEAMPFHRSATYQFVATVYGTGNHGRQFILDDLTPRDGE